MFRKTALAGALAAILAVGVTACGNQRDNSGDAASTREITVAVAGPMTGDYGVYGQNQLAGVQFYAKQINDAGGIPSGPLKGAKVKVISYDDAGDPNQGASIAQKACDDSSVLAVFGHSMSTVTLAAEPIYERCGLPLIVSYSSNPKITETLHKNLFRTIMDDVQLGGEMATLAKTKLGFTKVGALVADNDYGAGLKASFVDMADQTDLEVVDSITTTAGQKDFTPQLTKLKDSGVDSLVLLNDYTEAALQIKQARAMGWQVPILVGSGSNTPELIKIGGKGTEGTYIAGGFDPSSSAPGTAKFVSAYKAANGEAPGEASAMSYDSAYVLFSALEAGASDRASAIKKIEEIGTFDLPIRGKITFDQNHQPKVIPGVTASILFQVKDGQIVGYTG